jgi:hypothetical protein
VGPALGLSEEVLVTRDAQRRIGPRLIPLPDDLGHEPAGWRVVAELALHPQVQHVACVRLAMQLHVRRGEAKYRSIERIGVRRQRHQVRRKQVINQIERCVEAEQRPFHVRQSVRRGAEFGQPHTTNDGESDVLTLSDEARQTLAWIEALGKQ